jgi:hypothetical protein
MKISAVPSVGNTAGGVTTGAEPQASRVQQLRTQLMRTNASPEQYELPPEKVGNPHDNSEALVDEETKPLSPQLAAIAKQRRALQIKEREIADREKALSEKPATQVGGVDLAKLKSDPLGVLQAAGVTYDMLTEAILQSNDGSSAQIRALEAKLEALEKGVDEKLTEREAQSERQVLAEMQKEASQLVAEGEDFELVRETKSVPDVMKLIEKTYRQTGEVLEVREALKMVEDYLIEESEKLAGISKIRKRFEPDPSGLLRQPQPQMRTLTNRDTAHVPLTPKQRALAAFRGQLK